MTDLEILEQKRKSGLVQLPEGAFVGLGHNMYAFSHIKNLIGRNSFTPFYGDVAVAFVCF